MRSLLFNPGDDERKIAKGFGSAADALILDLEDAVASARKPIAREICVNALRGRSTSKKVFVRVNALDSGLTLGDLAAVMPGRPDGIVLPKCTGGGDLRLVGEHLASLEAREGIAIGATLLLPVATESGAAIFGLGTYAGVERLCGLFWGGEDLAADVGSVSNRGEDRRYTTPYQIARSLTLFGAAAAGVQAIDAVFPHFKDLEGLKAEAAEALRDGFTAKVAIHPDQIDIINAAFTPSAADIEWAERVIGAFSGRPDLGAVSIDGLLVDRPNIKAAERLLARRRGSG